MAGFGWGFHSLFIKMSRETQSHDKTSSTLLKTKINLTNPSKLNNLTPTQELWSFKC